MKKALITGVTGQDGSFLSELLLEKGYAVGSAAVKEAAQIAADLASDGARRQAMSQALAENFTVNSGLFIADFLMDAAEKYRNKQKETAGVL